MPVLILLRSNRWDSTSMPKPDPEDAQAELTRTDGEKNKPARLRLEFLDGLRGLAALYVLFFHIGLNSNFSDLPAWAWLLRPPVFYGHYAVCVFIVLSGYCLMLPVVRSENGSLQNGMSGFVRRRARRILPPYFAALAFSFVWVFLYEGSKKWTGHGNSFALEFSAGNILSHLLLVFNLHPDYWGATNGAFWSVASEWQIYFVYALVLLPVWRRFTGIGVMATAFLLGVGPHYLMPPGLAHNALDRACSWFIVLFALGMLGAGLRFSRRKPGSPGLYRFYWGSLGVALSLFLAGVAIVWRPVDNPWEPQLLQNYTWMTDVLAGGATLCLIMFCTRYIDLPDGGGHPTHVWSVEARLRRIALKILESRCAVVLGSFSYSLYLIHWPVLTAWLYVLMHVPLPPLARFILMWAGGTSFSLVLASLFSRWFERPFLSPAATKSRARKDASEQQSGLDSADVTG